MKKLLGIVQLRKIWEHYKATVRFDKQIRAITMLGVWEVYPVKLTEAQIEMVVRLQTLGIRNVYFLMNEISKGRSN